MAAADQHREQDAIGAVTGRLHRAFPEVPEANVDQSVQRVYHSFDQSRVRTFVPLLVEHAVRDELAHPQPDSGA